MTYDQKVVLDTMVRKPVEIATKQYDDAGRRVMIEPQAYGKPLEIPQGATFIVQVSKPDGHYVRTSGTLEEANGKKYICFLLTLQMLARFGDEQIDVTIKDGDTTITTMTLLNRIQRAAVQDEDIESSDEMDEFRQAIKDAETIHGYVEEAEQAAQTAEEAAASVEGKADEAAASARSAEAFATAASASAASAQSSGESAASSKTAAETAAINAASSERNAFDSATAAAGSARASSESAQSASASKESAAASATSASQSAETALSAKASASQSATSASSSAQSASQSATAASQSATSAARSAAEAAESAATLTVDPTLTIAGRAADAKATGDAIGNLNGALSEVSDGFYPYKIIPDTYISGAGVEIYYAGWGSSDFIPVVADNTVRIVGTVSSTYNSFYDSNKAFISGKNFTVNVGENEIKIPSNAAYMRLSNTTSAMANEKVYSLTSVRLSDVETTLNSIISEEKQNYYTGITLLSGRVFQGVYDSNVSTVHCTDYLTLIPGHVYALYGGYMDSNYTNYYNKAKTYMGAMPLTVLMNTYPYGSSYNCALFTAPVDCYYTRINFMNSDLDNGELQSGWYLRDVTERVLAQKNVLVVGDSISTDVYGNYKKWVTDLIDNGTLTQGLTYNTSQHATGFVAIYSTDTNSTFIKRITALGDLSGYDVVVTFGGINDWIQSINFDDFKNAVDAYFAYLVENATQARIVVLSPIHTALYGTTNNVGKTQKDYADYIKEVARAYSFPLLNLTDESGFCPDKSTTFRDMWTFLPTGFQEHDGVHPTAEWELKYLAPQIANFLEGLIA